jgi:hypothetical protein
MGGYAYNTIAAMGRQAGEILGIKGGDQWMREKFGASAGFMGRGFGQAWQQGGFIGAGQHAKRFFGFGFDQRMGMEAMQPYMRTMGQGNRAIRQMGYAGANVSVLEQTARQGRRQFGQLAREAPGVFRRRRIAGGVGLAAGTVMAANTVGLGNLATVGAGAGAGAVLGGAMGYGFAGSQAAMSARRAGGATGRRIGGKLGAGIAGLGLITGVL